MAIGVSVGVANNINAKVVYADGFDTTYNYANGPEGTGVWSLTNYTDQTTYYQVPSGSDPSVATFSGIFTSKTITSNVVITINNGTYGSGTNPSASTFSIYNSQACTTQVTATQSGTLASSKTYVDTIYTVTQANATGANGFSSDLAIRITKPGKTIRLNSITVTFSYTNSGGGDPQGPTALANPNPQYNDSNKTVSWTTDAHATKYQVKVDTGSYADINTETYDASGLSVGEQHTVYIKAVGDGENYSSTEGSVQFTPTAPFVSKNYVLCTSTTDLEAGASYLVTSGTSNTVKTMSTTESTNQRPQTNITISDSKVATAQDTLTVTLGGSSGAWTFRTENYAGTDGYLASGTGSNNHLKVNAGADNCTISFNNNNAAVITFSTNSGGRNILRYNSSSSWFACYGANNTQADIYLWREYTSKTPSSLAVTGTPTKLSGYYDSDTFDPTGITAYQVTYSDATSKVVPASDIVWPALTANMGTIRGSYTERGTTLYTPNYDVSVAADTMYIEVSGTMVTSYYTTDGQWNKGDLVVQRKYTSGKNTADVTASSTFAYYRDSEMTEAVASPAALGEGNNQTIYVKATYSDISNTTGYAQVVSVTIEHGTLQNDPLSVNEAITKGLALSSKGVTENYYYISGIVASVEENSLSDQEKQYATFVFDDSNASADFKAYQIQAADGCDNYSDLRAGAEVLIKCKIYKYNGTTIENSSSGSSILTISYTAPTLTGISLNKSTLYLGVGEDYDLVLSPIPVGAELGATTWNTTNQEAVTVDQNGHVVAVGVGDATITASSGGFEATCLVKAALKDTAQYSGATTNMGATGNAATIDLDDNVFSVDAAKGGSNNFPGLNADGDIRLYNGNDVFVTINSNYTITNIVIDYKSGNSYSKIYVNNVLVNGTNNAYTINNNSFKIHADGGTIKINSIDIFYRNAIATEKISRLSTQTKLSYHYADDGNGGFDYTNISIRFGGLITKALWNELDTNEHLISGFGVMITEGRNIDENETIEEYKTMAVLAENSTNTHDDIVDYYMSKAEMTTPVESGDNYYWNLFQTIDPADVEDVFVAVAYIKVGDEYVFMNQVRYSVKTLAADYLANRGCNAQTADGSLSYLAN